MSVLPQFDIKTLFENGGQNLIFLGNRRTGKSFLCGHILENHVRKFDLVISFLGTPFCNDKVSNLISSHYDARLNFVDFSPKVLDTLWAQQKDLLSRGISRNVCLVFDDVFTSSPHHMDCLVRLFMRGRHHKISCMFACVSVSLIPKNIRRCADFLFIFSCLTASDTKLLSEEYVSGQNQRAALWTIKNLQKYESLVLPTTGQRQKLTTYTAGGFRSLQLSDHDESRQSNTVSSQELPSVSNSQTTSYLHNETEEQISEYDDSQVN